MWTATVATDRLAVYDPRGGRIRWLSSWLADLGAVHGNVAYGVTLGRVYAVDLRTGRLRVLRRLPTTMTQALATAPSAS